jgi:hypothetical protein
MQQNDIYTINKDARRWARFAAEPTAKHNPTDVQMVGEL